MILLVECGDVRRTANRCKLSCREYCRVPDILNASPPLLEETRSSPNMARIHCVGHIVILKPTSFCRMVCAATLTLRGLYHTVKERRERIMVRFETTSLKSVEMIHRAGMGRKVGETLIKEPSHNYFRHGQGCCFEHFPGTSLALITRFQFECSTQALPSWNVLRSKRNGTFLLV